MRNSFDEEFVVNNGDVLVGMDGDFTPCVWSKGRALLNQRVGRILAIEGSNKEFLYYFLHAHLKDIEEATARTTVKHLSHSDVEKIHEPLPDDEEQQKVADCLTSLDEMIAAQGRKVEALKVHKKGLMQQLFPGDGETLPRLRFPEFRNAQAWEERPAGQLFANRTEGGVEGLPIYSVTMTNGLVKRSLLERSVDDIAEADGNKKALQNDIVYNMMRMWQGASGTAVEDCMVSPAYVVLAPKPGVHSHFFAFLLKLPRYLRLLTSHSQGLTKDRFRLYYKDFARIPLPSPDVREQEKIANLLSSIDSLIAAEVERLEALKTHKKGLMQQLFPSLGEVGA
jgi:type I restriction enzyme, S subunit